MTAASAWGAADHWPPPPDDEAVPQERLEDAESAWERTWLPVDLTAVLAGTHKPPTPDVGQRSDGVGILYPAKVHTLSSESEGGKTWFALELCRQALAAGQDVLYLDFEDDEGGVVGRLMAMQTPHESITTHFRYVRPTTALGTGVNLDDLRGAVTPTTTIAIIDGITEAMTLHGLNPLDNKEIADFGRILPRRLAAAGPAVLCLDHVTKDRETRGRYAIGGVHKLNALDGAALILENRTPFGVGVTGRSTIKIAKDRPGQLRRHALPSAKHMHWFGDLTVTSQAEDFTEVVIAAPEQQVSTDWRPTALMAKLHKLITEHAGEKGISGRHLQNIAKGNAPNNREALSFLVLEGYVSESPHKPLKPYDTEGSHS